MNSMTPLLAAGSKRHLRIASSAAGAGTGCPPTPFELFIASLGAITTAIVTSPAIPMAVPVRDRWARLALDLPGLPRLLAPIPDGHEQHQTCCRQHSGPHVPRSPYRHRSSTQQKSYPALCKGCASFSLGNITLVTVVNSFWFRAIEIPACAPAGGSSAQAHRPPECASRSENAADGICRHFTLRHPGSYSLDSN